MTNVGKDNIYIEACDDRGFLGGLLISKGSVVQEYEKFDPYYGILFFAAMDYVKGMLYNLNKNLGAAKNEVPRAIYALRLFEKMNIKGEPTKRVPLRIESSYDLLERYSKDYFVSNPTNDCLLLSLEKPGAELLKSYSSMRVVVDFGKGNLSHSGFIESVTMEDYKRKKDLDEDFDVNKCRLLMEEFPNINSFSINDMDEVLDIYSENRGGFRSIISPMNIIAIK